MLQDELDHKEAGTEELMLWTGVEELEVLKEIKPVSLKEISHKIFIDKADDWTHADTWCKELTH